MATNVKFLRDVNWVQVIDDLGIDREVRYDFDKGDVILLTDDVFAAELVTRGLAEVSVATPTTTEAEKGIFIPIASETATGTGTGDVSTLVDNGNGSFTHTAGGVSTTVSLASGAETLTSLSIAGNILTYTDEDGVDTDIDLSLYLDDTNLARLVSATVDVAGIATFTRDDASTFTLDLSALLPVTAATAISPAADDATGAVGVATNYAREDHKHAAQGVSADAEQLLKVGADGLHMLDPDDLVSTIAFNQIIKAGDGKLYSQTGAHIFVSETTLAPAIAGSPTTAEVTARALTGPSFAWYTGTDVTTDAITHVWHISPAGEALLVWEYGVAATPASSGSAYVAAGSTGLVAGIDAVAASSTGITATGSGFTIEHAGRYLLLAHAPLIAVSQEVQLLVNGVVEYSFDDDAVSNRAGSVIVDVPANALITLETTVSAQWSNENTGSLAVDSNATRVLVVPIGGLSAISDNLYTANGTLTAERTVTMGGFGLTLSGTTGSTGINDNGINIARNWQTAVNTNGFSIPNPTLTPDFDAIASRILVLDATGTGDLTIANPSAFTEAQIATVALVNNDVISRNFVFGTAYKDSTGQALGTVTLAPGTQRAFGFVADASSNPVLLGIADVAAASGLFDVSYTALAADEVLAGWNQHLSVILSDASHTFILPAASAGSVGDVIEIVNTSAFTLLVAANAADTVLGSASDLSIPPNTSVTAYNKGSNKVEIVGSRLPGIAPYSTAEQDTGRKWIDGKAVYEKVVSGVTGTAAPHGIVGLDDLIENQIVARTATNRYTSGGTNTNAFDVRVNDTTVEFLVGGFSAGTPFNAVLRYTKV